MSVNLLEYQEKKPHYLKMVMWRVYQATVQKLLPNKLREYSLRMFGAKIGRMEVKRSVFIYAPWNLVTGDMVCIGPRVEIYNKAPVKIGDNVVVSQDAWICTASHDISDRTMGLVTKPIEIGGSVWIAAKAAVLPGVTIGEGAVVGACSVVTKDVKAWTVVGGNPAKILKERKLVK